MTSRRIVASSSDENSRIGFTDSRTVVRYQK
jgi:hypothetical protein